MNNPIIICASGNSVPFLNSQYYRTHCGLPSKLQYTIQNNVSIGLNWFFKYGCRTTFTSWVDWQWYVWTKEQTQSLPLMVGNYDQSLKNHNEDLTNKNTILLKSSNTYYGKESIEKGVYTKHLVGIWAMSLAVSLGFKEIYLLGYDCCEVNGQTHFYQGVIDVNQSVPLKLRGKVVENRPIFRGVGKKEDGKYKTGTYNRKGKDISDTYFDKFTTEKDVKIYNVSEESIITSFPKISYEELYERVGDIKVDNNAIRDKIKEALHERACDCNR